MTWTCHNVHIEFMWCVHNLLLLLQVIFYDDDDDMTNQPTNKKKKFCLVGCETWQIIHVHSYGWFDYVFFCCCLTVHFSLSFSLIPPHTHTFLWSAWWLYTCVCVIRGVIRIDNLHMGFLLEKREKKNRKKRTTWI